MPPLKIQYKYTHYMVWIKRVQYIHSNMYMYSLRRNGHSWCDWSERGVISESELNSSSSDVCIVNVHDDRTSWR